MKLRAIALCLGVLGGCVVAGQPASHSGPAPVSQPVTQGQVDPEQDVRSQLPPAPSGFSWARYRNAFVLKPDGWNEHSLPDRGDGRSRALGLWATSPEPFSESQPFLMGFTVQIISDVSHNYGIDTHKAALAYLKPYLDAHKDKDLLLVDHNPGPPKERYWLRYRDAPEGKTPIVVHKFLMLSPEMDCVHVFTFEGPEASWDDDWSRFGTPILKHVVLANLPTTD